MRETADATHPAMDFWRSAVVRLRAIETTVILAERLGVTPASVTGMVQRLAAADPPLTIYEKHRGVELTPEGEKVALEIIRHHRLLELFLHETLGYTWDEVHAEADQ